MKSLIHLLLILLVGNQVDFSRLAGQPLLNTNEKCDGWHAIVAPQFQTGIERPDVSRLSEKESAEGIACLLGFEGNRKVGRFSGATRFDISQTFPGATIELDALYVISASYYRNWEHARGIALVDLKFKTQPRIMGPKTGARRAFPFVKRWYQRMKKRGMEKIRAEHDDPLNGSGLRWY